MHAQYSPAIEDRLNCCFVLTSALYFRMVAVDPAGQDQRFARWYGALHDAARDLAGLSEGRSRSGLGAQQIRDGLNDILHSLRDIADLAKKEGAVPLHDEVLSYLTKLEAEIAT
ncbi:hypothetical protein AADZ90_011825 [Aestuariibius sp. 2305UL40-4]|uniref:hypothetical protein n=1 Tax=Aestuariibius violaceus TaxID=3234132 RepID=UPI00345E7CBF